MSFLSKLFGTESADALVKDAEEKLTAGDLGSARIAFERAKEREKDAAKRTAIEARIEVCLDGLAKVRIAEATRLFGLGERELAIPEVEGALEIAKSPEVLAEAERLLEALSREPPPKAHSPAAEPSRTDRIAMIVGRWSKDEDAELDVLGEPLLEALLALEEGRTEEGATALEAIVAGLPSPRHVMRPLARARRASGNLEGAATAIRAYLETDSLTSEDLLASYAELASIHAERGDVEAAIATYEQCVEALDDDPRPCLLLGQYLRLEGRPAEAVEVLEIAASMMQQERDFQVVLEIALCRAALGEEDMAIALFEEVLAHFRTRGRMEVPEDAAVPLAAIYEKRGRLDRAADLTRVLAEHGPMSRRAAYGLVAARLVTELGLPDEARRLLRRARAATEDPVLREKAEAALKALEVSA
jgi:tetratricopeptide (TPR) repeat protein